MAQQIHRSPAYLSRNKHSYCFRLKVPDDLRCYVGKKELRYSLKTGYLGKAKSKARRLAGMIQQLFKKLREGESGSMELSDQEIQKLVLQHLKKIKADYDKPAPFGPFEIPPLESDCELSGLIDSLGERGLTGELKAEVASGEYSKVIDEARSLLAEILPPGDAIDEGSMGFKRLCAGLMRAEIMGLGYYRSQLTGNYRDDLQYAMDQTVNWNQGHKSAFGQQQQEQTSATINQAGEDFWNEFKQGWKPRSRTDYKIVIEQIVDGFGPDTQLHTIDYNRVKEFRQGLRDGSLTKYGKPMSIARVNLFMATTQRIFDFAMKKDKHLDRLNPADDLQLKDKRKPSEKRDVFTKEDLQKLFRDSKEYANDKHTKPANFWLPLLGLYTGARMEELCQLLLEDVVKRDGVWCIDIREDNAERKSVKVGERRIVPLHPFLVDDLRFPEYVQSINPTKKRVFHELRYVNNRWGHGFGQWFGNFKKRSGIDAPAGMKSFHSFRHTLINQLKQSDANILYVKEYVGHKAGKDITYDLYGKAYRPAMLLEKVVSKLNYPVDLSHLKRSKYVLK